MAPPAIKVRQPALDLVWIGAVAGNWLVVATAMVLALQWNNPVGYLLAVFVIGTRQHALAVRSHDGTHYHLSRNKRLNDFITTLLAAWPMAYSSSGYRRWHFEHHRTVGTDADPELLMYRQFGRKWRDGADRLKLFLTDLAGFGSYELLVLWYDLMQWRPSEPAWRRRLEELGLILWPLVAAGLLTLAFGWRSAVAVALMWYGALFTSFFAVYRMRCYSEHIGSEWTHQLELPPLWERLLYLPANTWLHWEHHTWPSVPLRRFKQAPQRLEAAAELQRPRADRAKPASAEVQAAK